MLIPMWKKKTTWKMGSSIKRGRETLKEDRSKSVIARDHRTWEQIMLGKEWSWEDLHLL